MKRYAVLEMVYEGGGCKILSSETFSDIKMAEDLKKDLIRFKNSSNHFYHVIEINLLPMTIKVINS